jgi:hypothetical protein
MFSVKKFNKKSTFYISFKCNFAGTVINKIQFFFYIEELAIIVTI